MKLSELINENLIFIDMPEFCAYQSKKNKLLEKLTAELCNSHIITEKDFNLALDAILAREASMSTGIGDGVAIPHAVVDFIETPIALLSLFSNGIQFDSIDSEPVQILVLLLVPKGWMKNYIYILANISKLFYLEKNRLEVLSKSQSAQVFSIIKTIEESSK